jgi:hypothetical protein
MRVGPQKRVELKCIHKHEEGTKGHGGRGGGRRRAKTYKEYKRVSYQVERELKEIK